MMRENEDEIILLNKAIACLEEVLAKNEIIRQQECVIKSLQDHRVPAANNESERLLRQYSWLETYTYTLSLKYDLY